MTSTGVSESERLWVSIDRLTAAVSRLCDKQIKTETKLEEFKTYLENHQKHKDRNNIIILSIIGVALTGINLFV